MIVSFSEKESNLLRKLPQLFYINLIQVYTIQNTFTKDLVVAGYEYFSHSYRWWCIYWVKYRYGLYVEYLLALFI